MTVSRITTRIESGNSGMAPWNNKPDWTAWLIFAAAFVLLHFGFCAFIVFRDTFVAKTASSGDGALSFVFFILSGVLTSVECAIGYAVVDVIVSLGRPLPLRVQRVSPAIAGAVAYASVWIVLAYRLQMPKLSENLAGSILNFNLNGAIPWGAMFLGGSIALIVKAIVRVSAATGMHGYMSSW